MAGHAIYEWIYVGVTIALLVYVGVDSWLVEKKLDISSVPANAQTIKVTGQQWFWTFEHENGTKEVSQLHLVKGVPYKFEITSRDVIHSFNMPDFALMLDAVPGRVNSFWFVPDQSGLFLIQCREYCGMFHYNMRAKLFVEEPLASNSASTNSSAAT